MKVYSSHNASPEERIERLNFALNAAGIGTWNFYPLEDIIDWDARCNELYGFPQQKILRYEDVLGMIHDEDRDKVREAVRKSLAKDSGGEYDVQFRVRGAQDSKIRWLHCKGQVYFNDEGLAYRFSGTAQDITEYVLEREKNALSEKMAQVALENSNSGYFLVSLTSDQIEYSPACAKIMTGSDSKNLKRSDLVSHLHPDDIAIRDKAYKEAEKTGKLHYEVRTVWDDGSIHWMRAKGSYLNDVSGKPYLLTGTLYDITAEYLHNQAIREAEELLLAAFNSASIGMAFYDLNGRFLKVNAAYIEQFGYSHDELTSLTLLDITHPDDRNRSEEIFKEVISGKRQNYSLIKRYIHKNGSSQWAQVNVTPIIAGSFKEARLLAIVNDINAEIQNEKALAESQAIFRSVANSSPTGLWLSDEAGKLTYLNKILVEWTGLPYESLLGTGWANAVIEEDREKSIRSFADAVSARTHYDVMFRMRKSDGNAIWCRAAGDPYYRQDGSYAGYSGFCMDINELVVVTNKIKEGELRFRNMIHQAPMAIGLLSGKEMIIEVGNEKMFEIWGKDPSVTGRKLIDALPEIKDQGFIELLEQVYETGTPHFGIGTLAKLVRKGKLEEAYFDFTYTPIRNGESITGIMVLATEVTQQVIARKALEQSEARFRSLIEEAPFATALYVGRDLIIDTANEEMIRIWGKDESVLGMKLGLALPELEGQPFLQILDDVFTSGVAYHSSGAKVDLVINGKLDTFYFNFTYKPLRNEQGEVYAILNMAVEVTEQVIARKKLEESELFSRSIIEHSPVAKLVLVNEDMIISTVNKNMLQIVGGDNSIIGKPLDEALPELSTKLSERLHHVFTTGETYIQPEEKLEIAKYGIPYTGYYNCIYKALYNTSGKIYGIIITMTEVTDQVLSRERIVEAEAILRGAVELAQLATWNMNVENRTFSFSKRFMEWLGVSEETRTAEETYALIPEEFRNKVTESINALFSVGASGIYQEEFPVINQQTGKTRVISVQGQVFYDDDRKPIILRGAAQDITEQRRYQQELERLVQLRTEELAASNEELQATNEELATTNEELAEANENLIHSNEELEQYAYVASHDLQEPLRKIRTFTDMLVKQDNLPEKSKKWVDKITVSTERMSLLIKSLLDFSRLLKSDSLMRPVDLNEVLSNVINDYELVIEEKRAIIKVETLPVIEGIGLQMNQLFQNLLGNALKFTRADVTPEVSISCKPLTQEEIKKYVNRPMSNTVYYHFRLTDNGIGFETKYADHVFEIFKRLHSRDVYPGSGIGLALCKRIVSNHNGSIYAESEVGKGTTFHIILPTSLQQ